MFRADQRFGVDRRGSASFTSFILASLNTTFVFMRHRSYLDCSVNDAFTMVALSFRCC